MDLVRIDDFEVVPENGDAGDAQVPDTSPCEIVAPVDSAGSEKTDKAIPDVVSALTQSLDKDSAMALNLDKEIQDILSLSPEEPYRKMFDAVLMDTHLTTHEKVSEIQRIVNLRTEDRKNSASVIKDLQHEKAKNFKICTEGHGQWILFGGLVLLFGGAAFTPVGRQFLKAGSQYIMKLAA